MDKLLSVAQASEIAGVSCVSIRRWCNDGKLPTYRSAGNHRRIKTSDLMRLISSQAMTTPVEPSQSYLEFLGDDNDTSDTTALPPLKDLHKYLEHIEMDDPAKFAPTLETINSRRAANASFICQTAAVPH